MHLRTLMLTFLLLSIRLEISAQNLVDSLIVEPSTENITFDWEHNLITLAPEKGLIQKYLAEYNYDSSLVIGGSAYLDGSLSYPQKMVVTNRQQIYIYDESLLQILVFSKDLLPIGNLDLTGINQENTNAIAGSAELIPIDFCVGPLGEFFVLNQDNRAYSLDPRGNVEAVFGGPDYGEGSTFSPVMIYSDALRFVYMADTATQSLLTYDRLGTFQFQIEVENNFRWKRVHMSGDFIVFYADSEYSISDKNGRILISGHSPNPILDLTLHKNVLWILHAGKILAYSLTED